MKKVLALVLAVMMLSTMAFATANKPSSDSHEINLEIGKVAPGSKIYVYDGIQNADIDGTITGTFEADVNSDNYRLSGVKYDKGRDLVEDVYFDDANDQLVIELKQDYTLVNAKDLEMELTLKGKKSTVDDVDVTIDTTVGYILRSDAQGWTNTNGVSAGIVINSDHETFCVDGEDNMGTWIQDTPEASTSLWKVVSEEDGTGETIGAVWGNLEFVTADEDTEVYVRVYDGDQYYLYNDQKANKDVLKAYADTDADITFLNFPGEPTFNATATIYFYKAEDTYVYEVEDGKIVDTVDWDDDEGAFVLKTRTLGNYIFSDVELETAEEVEENNPVENPDTGANDVVGIAAAMGVVALVSAAAVSLKK